MSVRSKSPLRMAGAVVNSGGLDTGEVNWTNGGTQRFSAFSGGIRNLSSGGPPPATGAPAVTADHAVLFSGAGRLNKAQPHVFVSGGAVVFYDSAVVARSGPFLAESGYGILGVIPANTIGMSPQLGGGIGPIDFGVPFNSGLCVAFASGAHGFTVTFTPESTLATAG